MLAATTDEPAVAAGTTPMLPEAPETTAPVLPAPDRVPPLFAVVPATTTLEPEGDCDELPDAEGLFPASTVEPAPAVFVAAVEPPEITVPDWAELPNCEEPVDWPVGAPLVTLAAPLATTMPDG